MTQRIKKLVYRRPNLSLGNNTDAILPGGPFLADFYRSRDFRLNENTIPTSYILWEWNGIDTSQFGEIVEITGSNTAVTPNGISSFEVTSSIFLRDNPWGGASTISTPLLNPPISGSFLKFYHSGSHNGYFVPINDLDVLNHLTSGIQIEYLQISASTGATSFNQNIAFGYVQYESDGKVSGMGVMRSLSTRVAFAYLNKSRATYETSSQQGSEDAAGGVVFATHLLEEIPSGSSVTRGRFESSIATFDSNGAEFGTQLVNSINFNIAPNTHFFTSSFVPTKFGFWVYNDTSTTRELSLFLERIRIVTPWRNR